MADTKPAGQSAETKPTTAAELSAAFPDLVVAIRAEAATAERARITGIDKVVGNRKGLDVLAAAMKADPACSPEKAAMQILEHENAQLAAQSDKIKGVEALTSAIKPAPNSGGEGGVQKVKATTPEGWKAEYAESSALQAEFATSEDYVAFKAHEGNVRILGQRKTA